jgi:hypothetical protein
METNVRTSQPVVTEECIAEHRLWTAVITHAIQEWRNGTLRQRREAQKFLFDNNDDFSRVCSSAGLDPASMRAQLLRVGHKIEMSGPWLHPLAA